MPRIYKLSRTGLKLLYKIRHHRGHGIHSPFVFNLITKVIEEKTQYHVYSDIRDILDSRSVKHYRLDRHNQLLFRLVNYFGSKRILELGSGYGASTICLTAPSSGIKCVCVESSQEKAIQARDLYKEWNRDITLLTDGTLPVLLEKQDCIYINLNNFGAISENFRSYLSDLTHEKTFIIVRGIRTNKRHQLLWRNIISMEERTAVLDLFNVGILFFDKRLYKWNYKISF